MDPSYAGFFHDLTGEKPYPYQVRLGAEPWFDVVEVPTGLGKTAGIGVAWLWKRLTAPAETPRRLVYCLPMRVLVDQTLGEMRDWIEKAASLFEDRGVALPTAHVLMGGKKELGWVHRPSDPAVIVGTQDMLLSRALMRGYGMRRYQWALHFGLLHNDALWLMDEIQLMGPGLTTSAQLEAFRRRPDSPPARPSRTVWMSATLRPEWLDTVDLRPHLPSIRTLAICQEDEARAADRIGAQKRLRPASLSLDTTSKTGVAQYVDSLAATVLEAHRLGTRTLVILNSVTRAQDLYLALCAQVDEPRESLLLLHSRFRPAERTGIEKVLRSGRDDDRIVVATQAVEAGVDISSATLFTELAPWSSLVQRFGRCNRYGEVSGGAEVRWIDLEGGDAVAAPYEEEELSEARSILEDLDAVGLRDLPPVPSGGTLHPVVRRKDLLALFDTEPDLSGFDIDVSPYIRDTGTPQVQVFWRDLGETGAADQPEPLRGELCPASMGQIGEYLKKKVRGEVRRYWVWDSLSAKWVRVPRNQRPRPGAVLMLAAADGGYREDVGFRPGEKGAVSDLGPDREADDADAMSADPESVGGRFVTLADHTRNVCDEVALLGKALDLDETERDALEPAALWHDVGKAHPAFQRALLDYWGSGPEAGTATPDGELWAKSSSRGRLDYRITKTGPDGRESTERRRYFRHELASMLAWLEHGEADDLVAYLIAAHHGKVRMALRALPDERPDPGGARLARGVCEGDTLPPVELDGLSLPETRLRLELMELGHGAQGPSWTERTLGLLESMGPFRLAWLEALLMVADQRASAAEREAAAEDVPAGATP